MATFTLNIESVDISEDYPVAISKFENTSDQRRATSSANNMVFNVRSPILTQTGAAAYKTHFDAQTGGLTQFQFVHPVDGVTYNVHYVPRSFRTSRTPAGFVCSFAFQKIT